MAISLNFEIVGNNEITDWLLSEDVTLAGKIERTVSLLTIADDYVPINISKIGTRISKIIANSSNADLKILTGSGEILLPINGMFVWSVGNSYASGINAISQVSVRTLSTASVTVDVAIIGV